MSDNFFDEIAEIAGNVTAEMDEDYRVSISGQEPDEVFLKVLDQFFRISEEGVRIFNRESQGIKLAINELSPEFLDLFLDIQGRRGGYSIVSPYRIVIVFDEDPSLITVIGKQRKRQGDGARILSPPIQLIKIEFSKGLKEIEYRDNSGVRVEPRDIVPLFIKWVAST